MRDYAAAAADAPTLVFGHGAGAGHAHPWIVNVATGLAARGLRVVTFDFPYKAEGRKLPDKAPVLELAFAVVWRELIAADAAAGRVPRAYFAGGKSMGGRIASQAAAKDLLAPELKGLIFFGYPLHPPGKPQQRRDAHLPDVRVPMLFLQGTRDPFGSPEEMRALVMTGAASARGTLEIIEGGDHSLAAPRDRAGASLAHAMDRAVRATSQFPAASRN